MANLSSLTDDQLLAALTPAPAQRAPSAAPAARSPATPASFVQQYGDMAASVGKQIGVDPNLLLAQWGHETGWGKSVIPGTNNLGNIKQFGGGGVAARDNMTGSNDAYRAYQTPDAFGADYASLISRKYPGAVGAGSDMARFAVGLAKGGYAEDPQYAGKLQGALRTVQKAQPGVLARVGDAVASAISGTANAATPRDLSSVSDDDLLAALTLSKGNTAAGAQAYPTTSADVREAMQSAAREDQPGLLQNIGMGALRGAANIGATLLAPIDAAARAVGVQNDWIGRNDRREKLDEFAHDHADTNSLAYKGGKLGAEIAGTAPVGGILGKAVGAAAAPLVAGTRAAPIADALATSLATGGFRIGQGVANPLLSLAIRGAGGAGIGGASAGLVNPADAGTGALIGGALPGAAVAGNAVRRAVVGGGVTPEVQALAKRAAELGIDIPADRVVNSKPLNAVASGLNYLPFSGRAATEAQMESQVNRALSRTFGQNSDNVTAALRKARDELGAKFDSVLKNNAVKVDDTLLNRLADVESTASRELGQDGMRAIRGQIDELMTKGATGQIDGQAAYNIKQTLDRIGGRSTPEAYHARQMRGALVDALDRSLGPDAAAAFSTTRKQYGNMLALEKLATNGAEGGISVARLANLKNINNPDLQEIADIAAQFVKPREGQHGAMQRAVAALGLGGAVGVPGLIGTSLAGRGLNSLLNAAPVRNALMKGAPAAGAAGGPNALMNMLRTSAPLLPAQ